MSKLMLYLMLGYPGAGKTTTAKIIQELTGAEHLWADHVRREVYGTPTYTHGENLELYNRLDQMADELLAEGKSVIFDTNFNFYKDRQKLREIASKHGADAVLVWVVTPKEIAKQRATDGTQQQTTRILGNMAEQDFERMSHNLEPPHDNEHVLKINGTQVSKENIQKLLGS